METDNLISIKQFCIHHSINNSFLHSLNEYGLIDIIIIEEDQYLYPEQIKDIERMIRLYYDLDINIEGIDVVSGLLDRIEHLENQLANVRNKLKFYEE